MSKHNKSLDKETIEALNSLADSMGMTAIIMQPGEPCPFCCECDQTCDAVIEGGKRCNAIYRKEVCPVCQPLPDNPADNKLF